MVTKSIYCFPVVEIDVAAFTVSLSVAMEKSIITSFNWSR